MEEKIQEIAQRIRELRETLNISVKEMAQITGLTEQEYKGYEEGNRDFSFTFLYHAAKRFGVDIKDLLTGESPTLSGFCLVRKGEGLKIERRKGFSYRNMAYLFKHRLAEPFIVEARYEPDEQDMPLALSTHEGQEFDFVLSGSLRVEISGHTFTMGEGDALYYDSSRPHGMAATGGGDCKFLAMVIAGGKDA